MTLVILADIFISARNPLIKQNTRKNIVSFSWPGLYDLRINITKEVSRPASIKS